MSGAGLFFTGLAVGAVWPWVFFARHLVPASAWVEVIAWGLGLGATIQFFRTRPVAGVLMVPAMLWLSYAAALSVTVMRLNAISHS